MDIETVQAMKTLSKKEVDLEALKNKVLSIEDNIKIKFFRTYARNNNALPELEKQVNAFIKNEDICVQDIKFDIQKNFLLGSTAGEYEEDAYAMVIYEE